MNGEMTPAEMLDTIIGKASALRAVGVYRVKLQGIEFELLPIEPTTEPLQRDEMAPRTPSESPDALNDVHTFPGGRMPHYPRRGEMGK